MYTDPVNLATNKNLSTLKPLYFGPIPGTTATERMQWFNDPRTYEYQQETRPVLVRSEPDELRHYRLTMESIEKRFSIERMIISRCLPAPYRKDVGTTSNMYVTQMDDQLWKFFINNHEEVPTINKKFTHGYPDHGFWRSVEFHRVGWVDGDHPTLHTPFWFLAKWEEMGFTYKTYVSSVSFIRNSWSGIVRAEFKYETWVHSQFNNNWQFC